MDVKTLNFYVFLLCLLKFSHQYQYDEKGAEIFLQRVDSDTRKLLFKNAMASWNYESNITEVNLQEKLRANTEKQLELNNMRKELQKFHWEDFKNEDMKRKFKKLSVFGFTALSEQKYTKLITLISTMGGIYGKAKICSYNDSKKCDLSLDPDLYDILSSSDDEEELKHIWVEWRNATGKKVKEMFAEYVELANEAARNNNLTDTSEMWLLNYEDENIKDEISDVWEQIRPLYLQVHAYVRRQLRDKYGEKVVPKEGPIPAHLLGNMWSQTWQHVARFSAPFKSAPSYNVTDEMIKQGYTPHKIFKTAEEFFVSLNMTAMPPAFWEGSILEKPQDGRELICHASAWDFYNGNDFRIRQCTRINFEDLIVAHHEMGHIQYYLQYDKQPIVYKGGANEGFHEAIGDVLALSVSTKEHLHKIGLIKNYKEDYEQDLNTLYEMGINKITFLPFSYILDLWRWGVFKGNITKDNYNYEWWKLRETIQGIQAPVPRSGDDFDPGSKFHVVASVPYIRYFVSFIIQFQFHKALCEKAGQYEPNNPLKQLHKCDIYRSSNAGNALADMMKMGSSKPWRDTMEALTGERKLDASALLEYFKPLEKWLREENARTGETIGWKVDLSKYS